MLDQWWARLTERLSGEVRLPTLPAGGGRRPLSPCGNRRSVWLRALLSRRCPNSVRSWPPSASESRSWRTRLVRTQHLLDNIRWSGVIFTITPQVRQAVVDLTIDQQLSDFVQTTTGVNGSPTLTKRQLTTNVQMRNAEVLILDGLTEEKTSETQTGLSFLPSIFRSRVTESSKSEILLVIQMMRM